MKIEDVERLATNRLLNIFKNIRKGRFLSRIDTAENRNQDLLFEKIKEVLAEREHVARKKPKRCFKKCL